jgi:integrase
LSLKITGLSKTYPNGVRALKDLTLTIGNHMFGLLGPNGAGKSTLMRTVATLQDPDSGTVQLDDLNVLTQKDEERKVLGYLPQEFGVYPRMSALDMLHHLAILGCGLRRAELLRIQVEDLQQREGRWVLPDLTGKGNRIRTVTVPAGVKARIDAWLSAAGITTGRIFRPVNKRDVMVGTEIRDEKAVWRLVMGYAQATALGKLAPHDLRRTCAKLCRKAGGELEQIQLLLGHASIQTTERYLGTEQALAHAVNDAIGLEM